MNPPATLRIGIMVYPQALPSGVIVPADVFGIANTLAQLRPAECGVRFVVEWLSVEGGPCQVGAMRIATAALAQASPDVLMLPGIVHATPNELSAAIAAMGAERAALRLFAQRDTLILSACSGSCLMAATGLLDGKHSTTSWWLSAYFRKRFPDVILDAEQLVVRDGQFLSSGGITSYFDLSLWLIGHSAGEALRQLTAKILVTDSQRASQAPYMASAMLAGQGHAMIDLARRWLNERLEQAWTLAELAEHCNTSQRTLLRRFQQVLGHSPIQYSQSLRVERAKALLETTRLSLQDITTRCGYEDVSTFSKVFKRWVELTPRDYRKRFGLSA
jgi:transcriptional regulator GlxA family with amidase domain